MYETILSIGDLIDLSNYQTENINNYLNFFRKILKQYWSSKKLRELLAWVKHFGSLSVEWKVLLVDKMVTLKLRIRSCSRASDLKQASGKQWLYSQTGYLPAMAMPAKAKRMRTLAFMLLSFFLVRSNLLSSNWEDETTVDVVFIPNSCRSSSSSSSTSSSYQWNSSEIFW